MGSQKQRLPGQSPIRSFLLALWIGVLVPGIPALADTPGCSLHLAFDHRTDDELVDLFRAGEKNSALEELRRRFDVQLRAFVAKILTNRFDLDDVSQATWLTVLLKLDGFQRSSSFKTWLFAVGRNCALDFNNRASREERRRQALAVRRTEMGGEDGNGASDRMLLWEEWERCDGAVAQLRPRERDVLRLSYFGHLSYQQVADALDIPIGTVRSTLSRTLAKLRGALSPQIGCDPRIDRKSARG